MVNDWSTWCNRIGWTAKQREPLGAAAVNGDRLTQIEANPSGGV
jgi:hypothetical protein